MVDILLVRYSSDTPKSTPPARTRVQIVTQSSKHFVGAVIKYVKCDVTMLAYPTRERIER